MARRRGNGQGSVFLRRDGRWEAAAYVLHADGTSRRASRYAPTRAQTEEKLAQLLACNAELVPVDVDRTTTVAVYLTWWLDAVAVHRLRPTKLVTYRQYTQRYLIPGLGRHRLVALSTGQVQQWLNSLRQVCWCCTQSVDARRPPRQRRCCALGQCCESFLTAGTIAYLHAILSSALAHAVREDKLLRNVASPVRLPVPGQYPDTPLTADEAHRILTAARKHRLWALFELTLACGLRRGELLGLRWADLDQDQAVATVEQSVQRRRDSGALVTLPTKSAASNRTVPIPAGAVTTLREHRRRQDHERDQQGQRWRESGLVFTNTVGTALDGGLRCASGWACPACRGSGQRPGRRRRSCQGGAQRVGAVPGAGPRAGGPLRGFRTRPRSARPGRVTPGREVGCGLVVRADRVRDWRVARTVGPRLDLY